ncbi:MAG TPA: TetR/AcrR family transcriptional regulator [Ktedonobacterales bacterium]
MPVNKRSDNQTRRYDSPKRRQQADATRRRILAAAEALFEEQGYAAVTMEAIARRAGVSLATIYIHFPGRVAVVGALAEEIVGAPELSVEQVTQNSNPVEQMRIGARILRRLNERSWLITDILRSQRGSDPEVARLWELWQQRHLEAMRRAMSVIAQEGGLRPGLSAETAADVFYALAGTEVYRALVQERGWSPEHYERWLFETGCREFLAHP